MSPDCGKGGKAKPGSQRGTCRLQPALSLRGLLSLWEAVGRDSDSGLNRWLKKEDWVLPHTLGRHPTMRSAADSGQGDASVVGLDPGPGMYKR